ncbi:STAS domain-containing protein [Actinomadura flavalba]|uniref:STAS domain-containing protein n=1 Tax=Actinomadura flavalba TaxID=1120938 RepID=UPI000377BAF0|nr:STAS domain-containing protein [Actinomadura flavalba]
MNAPAPLLLTVTAPAPGEITVHLDGDLDIATADLLTDTVTAELAAHGDARVLRLDCTRLGVCDSLGLAALLMVHRKATAAGALLRLDHRPPILDRILDITGTLEHLTGESSAV